MYDQYKEYIKKKLSKKRYAHSLNVADSARILAEKLGENKDKAYLAGLLHDVCKDESNENLLQIIKDFGIMLNNVELAEPKLWHAIAGSVYISEIFKIDDADIINAVRYHTTARAGMTIFEKVLYLADFISADRDYDGVDIMRNKVKQGVLPAMQFGLQFTIIDLSERLRAIHPDTVAAYNEIICS